MKSSGMSLWILVFVLGVSCELGALAQNQPIANKTFSDTRKISRNSKFEKFITPASTDCIVKKGKILSFYIEVYPNNGKIEVFADSRIVDARNPNSVVFRCNGRTLRGGVIRYIPNQYFLGEDYFSVRVVFPSGKFDTHNVKLIVQ